ncbi:ATP-binding protein [Intrasporangium sp. YIM S08009]|uniref:ATP-binding protein n=1 Tax=Intrasporangium zincisolvens TaxID=3080018 RepID=UPI002B056D63|nr:ATP-binding protein [Intrasporangium sp. YIM S08009]
MTGTWRNTTHDWAATVDTDHLADIRARAAELAPGGATHLVLEVLAYADDEAASAGRVGRCVVTVHADGSLSVADDGRGTDTRVDASGRTVRKPVMATRDLRFFDVEDPPQLPDGHPRRGMSVVAALSEILVHTNRRLEGSWTQTYDHGVPVTDLVPVVDQQGAATATGTATGTTVRFRLTGCSGEEARSLTTRLGSWPHLEVVVVHEEPSARDSSAADAPARDRS